MQRLSWHPVPWLLLAAACLCHVHGQDTESAKRPAIAGKTNLGQDELLPFQDLPIVVSASRQAEKQGHTAVPVSVFTKEDIHYSGAMVLPEVFPFIPGVDVLQLDRNRYGIGVRGLHGYFSDRTLTLIDGRSAEHVAFGGAEYLRYPLLLEDIERIEVVRGPGGAAWGANALNGVVNIITKKPEDAQGVLAGTAVDEFGDTSSYVRWGAKKGDWAWRTSFGYNWFESSESAIHEDDFTSYDFHWDALFDGVATVKVSPDTRVSFGVSYQRKEMGQFENTGVIENRVGVGSSSILTLPGIPINEDGSYDTGRAFVKAEHNFGNGMEGYLQWFGNLAHDEIPTMYRVWAAQNDVEGQLSFSPAKNHQMTVGANGRWIRLDTTQERPTDFLMLDDPTDEAQAGAFVLDRWEVNSRLTFEGQVRGDYYSGTHPDWAARLGLIVAADEGGDHLLRFAGARAFRTPFAGLHLTRAERVPTPFGVSAGNFQPNEGIDNEGIWSAEFGYTGKWLKNLTFRLDTYYQRYEDLIGFDNIERSVDLGGGFLFPVLDIRAHNNQDATAYGGEAELIYKWDWGQLSAWYAHHYLEGARDNRQMRAFLPAEDKVGLTTRLFLPHQVTLNWNYRGDIGPLVNTEEDFKGQGGHRIDFTVTKRFDRERFELQLGARDLLDQTGRAVRGVGSWTRHSVPGRTFFARFQMKF